MILHVFARGDAEYVIEFFKGALFGFGEPEETILFFFELTNIQTQVGNVEEVKQKKKTRTGVTYIIVRATTLSPA